MTSVGGEPPAPSGARRPTMRDVAAVAGVSLRTVSRVVNGGLVDAAMARRVQDGIEVLGYRQNLTASALRRSDRASRTLGLVFEDVANPFFSALHRGVEDVVHNRGFLTFACSSDEEPAHERRLVEALAARGVDGLIVTPTTADHSYSCAIAARAWRSCSPTARRASSTPTRS